MRAFISLFFFPLFLIRLLYDTQNFHVSLDFDSFTLVLWTLLKTVYLEERWRVSRIWQQKKQMLPPAVSVTSVRMTKAAEFQNKHHRIFMRREASLISSLDFTLNYPHLGVHKSHFVERGRILNWYVPDDGEREYVECSYVVGHDVSCPVELQNTEVTNAIVRGRFD